MEEHVEGGLGLGLEDDSPRRQQSSIGWRTSPRRARRRLSSL